MDDHKNRYRDELDDGLDRTRWVIEALIGAGIIILIAYGLFAALVPA